MPTKRINYKLDDGEGVLKFEVKEDTDIDDVRKALKAECANQLGQFAAVELKLSLTTDGTVIELNPTALHSVIPDGSTVVIHHPEYKTEVVRKRLMPTSANPIAPFRDPVENSVSQTERIAAVKAVRLAHLGVETDDFFYLYLRDTGLKQLHFLDTAESPLVHGPPGTGKSVVTWLFALQEAKKGKKVLWRHYVASVFSSCLITKEQVVPVQADVDDLDLDADILILDGLVENMKDEIFQTGLRWRFAKTNRKLCVITSQQLNIKIEDLKAVKIDTFEVLSWTREEYLEAIKYKPILNQVKHNIAEDPNEVFGDQFEDKYYLAGGSCRWMFHYSSDDVMRVVGEAVRDCSNIKVLVSNQEGDRSASSTNRLIQTTSAGRFVVSEHAMRLLSQRIAAEFILLAKSACPNPAFDGWILEMDFLLQIKQESGLTLFAEDSTPVIWKKLPQKQFHKPSELKEIESGWLVPDRWNQGGYDAVRVEVEKQIVTVKFVQVTRAGQHSFKARYMNEMMSAIAEKFGKMKFIREFYFVVPRGKLASFKFPASVDSKWADAISGLEFARL